MFGGIVSSPRNTLSPKQALDLARIYLENASQVTDIKISMVLCHDTEVLLSQAKKAAKHSRDNDVQDGVAAAYVDLGLLLHRHHYENEAQVSFEKARKMGAQACDLDLLAQHQQSRFGSALNSNKGVLDSVDDAPVTSPSPPQPHTLPAALQLNRDSLLVNAATDPRTTKTVAALQSVITGATPSGTVTASQISTASAPVDNIVEDSKGDIGTVPLRGATTAPRSEVVAAPTDNNATALKEGNTTMSTTNIPTISDSEGGMVSSVDNATAPAGDIATIPLNIFIGNVRPPTISFKPPEADERLHDTLQLACCLGLMQISASLDDIADPVMLKWVQATKSNLDEKGRLETMARNVIRAFKRDELKDSKAVTEVVYLAPVLEKDDFQYLLREFYSGIEHSGLLDMQQLEGLAQLIQGAGKDYIEANDLVIILKLLSTRLQDTHHQSPNQLYKLTLTVSHVLDAMADAG
ncbi:hypothetical protein BGX31_002131, partial [Mortierella sp. GBA43]